MNAPIALRPYAMNGETIQTVNARELHEFLGVGKDFSTWIKSRIEQYDFADGRDFVTFENLSSPVSGSAKARPQMQTDYHLTLDMAKELCMVERNEKGKQARQYFIECERRAKALQTDPMKLLSDPAAMRGLLLTYTEKVIALESKVQEMLPDVRAYERFINSDGMLSITDAAKLLGVQPKKLFNWMSQNDWIYRRGKRREWAGHQPKLNQQLLDTKAVVINKEGGKTETVNQVMVTAKGIDKLGKGLDASGVPTVRQKYSAGCQHDLGL